MWKQSIYKIHLSNIEEKMIKGIIGIEHKGKFTEISDFGSKKSLNEVSADILGEIYKMEEIFRSNVELSNLTQALADAYLNISLDGSGSIDVEPLRLFLTLLSFKLSTGNPNNFQLKLIDVVNKEEWVQDIVIDTYDCVFDNVG
jgi:hypothetical protein